MSQHMHLRYSVAIETPGTKHRVWLLMHHSAQLRAGRNAEAGADDPHDGEHRQRPRLGVLTERD